MGRRRRRPGLKLGEFQRPVRLRPALGDPIPVHVKYREALITDIFPGRGFSVIFALMAGRADKAHSDLVAIEEQVGDLISEIGNFLFSFN